MFDFTNFSLPGPGLWRDNRRLNTGALVTLLRVARLALSPRLSTGLYTLVAVLALTAIACSQAEPDATSSAKPRAEVATVSPTPESSTSAGSGDSGQASSEEIRAAAQIQAAAEKDQSDLPDADAPPRTARPGNPSAAIPPAKGQDSRVPAKYDVALIGQRNVGSGVNFYSLDCEIALGRQLSEQVEQSSRLVTDTAINEYINRVGQNLVRNSDARVPFTIKVLDSEEVNAFALPGGYFYVDSGMILAADNEAELAGGMAHEIAHVAARHATKNITRAQIWNMAQVPLLLVGGPVAYAISQVASLAVPLGFLKFSRDAEREADLLGLEYDYAAGYDPHAFVEFFEKLKVDEKKKHNLIAKAFSTHPMNSDRIKAAQDEIRRYLPDRDAYVVDTSDFQSIKARLYTLENSHQIGGPQDSRRPVLMRRTISTESSDPSGAQAQDDDATSASTDAGRPTLTRRNQSSGSDSTGTQTPDSSSGSQQPMPAPTTSK